MERMRVMRLERLTERALTLLVAEKVYNSLIAIIEALQLEVSAKSDCVCYFAMHLLVKGRRCRFCTSA